MLLSSKLQIAFLKGDISGFRDYVSSDTNVKYYDTRSVAASLDYSKCILFSASRPLGFGYTRRIHRVHYTHTTVSWPTLNLVLAGA